MSCVIDCTRSPMGHNAARGPILTLTARRNRTMPARQLSSELASASGVRRQSVYRRLRAGGLCARRPAHSSTHKEPLQ
ncbi:hypothetical protein ANN_08421 [Periplaneta americana]|uniref:Transposase Tc1-like domain-containing protein n=1 Tax=Periplaneta americana TaxID=6978 RepID=A0ABQ8T300_PERAM|nr:hypothetical protein ANN_08421 [Periplaneta americana]